MSLRNDNRVTSEHLCVLVLSSIPSESVLLPVTIPAHLELVSKAIRSCSEVGFSPP